MLSLFLFEVGPGEKFFNTIWEYF